MCAEGCEGKILIVLIFREGGIKFPHCPKAHKSPKWQGRGGTWDVGKRNKDNFLRFYFATWQWLWNGQVFKEIKSNFLAIERLSNDKKDVLFYPSLTYVIFSQILATLPTSIEWCTSTATFSTKVFSKR